MSDYLKSIDISCTAHASYSTEEYMQAISVSHITMAVVPPPRQPCYTWSAGEKWRVETEETG